MALFGIKEDKHSSVSSDWMLNEEIKRHLPLVLKINGNTIHITIHFTFYAGANDGQKFLTQRFFKYTFVRNPFDRLVSSYKYRLQYGGIKSDFKEFTFQFLKSKNDNVWNWSQLEFTRGCDFVGKFETCKKTLIKSATKLESHDKNFHTKTKQNTNTTPNTTMTRQDNSRCGKIRK